ncbi:MAG: ATP-binding protein [Deltaproteobacteria bacterium]|nr:ATP-binding protein [Deltaproteobacteria bacterium]
MQITRMWFSRELSTVLKKNIKTRPAILLTGARQAGKTSLLREVFPKAVYASLDLPLVAEEAENSGQSFLAKYNRPLILDEVQYAPSLFRYLKVAIDEDRKKNGQYLLTGSQKFSLMQGVSESLAGRVAIFNLHSLSAREFQKHTGEKLEGFNLLEWIWKGGYPEVHAQSLDPGRFYADYVTTYLERDLRQIVQVKSLRDFHRFLRLLATRSAQLISYHALASDLGLSPHTIKAWMSALEASNIIYLLPPYFENLGKRQVKSPKVYFLDTGLLCFLLGIHQVKDIKSSSLLGSIFETHVLGQMVRHFDHQGMPPEIYFYRDHHGMEVDFIIPSGAKLKLYEAKFSEKPDVKAWKNLLKVREQMGANKVESLHIINSLEGKRKIAKEERYLEGSVALKSL